MVVGSGFIGCEAAASLARRGLEVTLVSMEDLPQAARLGDAAGQRLREWLEDEGVQLRLGAEVERIEAGRRVQLADGQRAEGDLVLIAAGVDPQGALAEHAGLATARARSPSGTGVTASRSAC